MNRIEFEKTMEVLEYDDVVVSTTGATKELENVHLLRDCVAYYSGDGYAYISGRIPLEFANIIWEKYGDDEDIEINTYPSNNPVPEVHAVDEVYEREIRKIFKQVPNSEKREELCRQAEERLKERDSKNKYITQYTISSTDALVTFLTEMKDYYAAKEGVFSDEVRNHDEYIAEIFAEVLKKINPGLSIEEWMKKCERDVSLYYKTLSNTSSNSFGRKLRSSLNKFDKIVNAYQDEEFELADIHSYIQNVDIYGTVFYDSEKGRGNCARIIITDKNTKNNVIYYREADGFSYQVNYKDEDGVFILCHYFRPRVNVMDENNHIFSEEEGEVVYLYKESSDGKEECDVRYNITKNTIEDSVNKTHGFATKKQKAFVYEQLQTAIDLASNITHNNMAKNVQKVNKPNN